MLKGRRYNEGLHQAIEAKEGVEVQEESMTLATISFQNYFRLYQKLSGMTGTASTEAEEFHQIYKLEVIEIPSNKPVVRDDRQDRIYKTEQAKFKAIAKEVQLLHQKGQPVLIGTASVEKNETLSSVLKKAKIPHQTLNAKNNEGEAAIIAKAGNKQAVTLATNIAGRGTDIVLGEGVKELGGLYVLGSERHESRRIDNQLRGRAGRQGDPGVTQFFVSTEDDLMRIFGGDRIASIMNRLRLDEDMPIENSIISRSLEAAQKKVEGFNFDLRKNVVQYDDVMNRHRRAIYTLRREILEDIDIRKRVEQFIKEETENIASLATTNPDTIQDIITETIPLDEAALDRLFDNEADKFAQALNTEALEIYNSKETVFTPDMLRKIERDLYLQILDNLWMQHLENMDHLREGINWISVGQRDPLVEYRRQGQVLFDNMQNDLRHDLVRAVLHVELSDEIAATGPVETDLTIAARDSVDNNYRIIEADEFEEKDFSPSDAIKSKQQDSKKRKKARKIQRQNKKKGRK